MLALFFILTLTWTWGFGFAPVLMGIEGTPLGTFLFYFGGGFALDRPFVRYGFTKATLLLGFIWGIWHMAWYFTPGQAQYDMWQFSPLLALMWTPQIMIFKKEYQTSISFADIHPSRTA